MSEIHSIDIDQASNVNSNNQNSYQIRSMVVIDLDDVIEIEKITWGDECWDRDNFLRCLSDPLCKCWVLEDVITNHTIIGYGCQCVYEISSSITNLTIHPNQCGRGLGGLLLRHMISYARQCNVSNITLEVHITNKRAYKLYTKHGFQIVRCLPQYYSEYSDAYEMLLSL